MRWGSEVSGSRVRLWEEEEEEEEEGMVVGRVVGCVCYVVERRVTREEGDAIVERSLYPSTLRPASCALQVPPLFLRPQRARRRW